MNKHKLACTIAGNILVLSILWPLIRPPSLGAAPPSLSATPTDEPAGPATAARRSGCPAPSLIEPADGATVSGRTLTFRWNPLSGCTYNGYSFRVCTSADMDDPAACFIDAGEGSAQRTETIDGRDNQDLYWGVKAANAAGAAWAVRRLRIQPPTCSPKADQVAFFEYADYGGLCVVRPIGDYPHAGAIGLPEDTVTSVRVGSSVFVTLCRDEHHGGACETLTGDDSNLSDNGIGDNQVSSARVELQSCIPTADQIALFEHADYGGRCVVKESGAYPDPTAIGLPNDTISSIRVGDNVQARLCRDANDGGVCETLAGDDANLGDNGIGHDQVSSAHVEARSTCTPSADQVALYADAGYGGGCVVLNVGNTATPGGLGALGDDNAGSIKVGDNVRTILCQDPSYAGRCAGFSGDEANLDETPIGADTVSSARVQLRTLAPAAPTLQSPGSGATFHEGDSISLLWSVSGDEYQGQMWGSPAGTTYFGWQSEAFHTTNPQWAGYTYSWRVRARNAAGQSGWSSTRTFTVKPAAPSGLTAQTASCSQVVLYWSDRSKNEEGYRIYRDGAPVGQVAMDATTYQDAGLGPNTAYDYSVRAYRGSIESDASEPISITTPWCLAPQPDLRPAAPSGYAYPVVPSSIPGTHQVNNLVANQTTYFDWHAINGGGASASGSFYVDLWVDGARHIHQLVASLDSGSTIGADDLGLLITTPGWHTVRLIADPGSTVVETDETNNTWERSFYWAPSAPYADNMEGGQRNWTAGGLWHQVDQDSPYPEAHGGSHSWWYGQDATGSYDTGSAPSGALTSPPIFIPAAGHTLRFWYRYETETQDPARDQRWVQISVDGGPFTNALRLSDDPPNAWLQSPAIDLSAYAGHAVQVRFWFNTTDAAFNGYRGWYIDDVAIAATPPPDCADDHEPNDTAAQATAIAYGQTLDGVICPGGDIDWYAFDGAAGDRVVIDIDARVDASLLDSFVTLLDGDGVGVLAENDDEIRGKVQDSHLGYQLSYDGRYTIKVKAWNHPSVGGADYFYAIRLLADATSPPTAEIVAPGDGAWLNQTLQPIRVSADDESGVRNVAFLWHSGDWQNDHWAWLGDDWDGRDGWRIDWDTAGIAEQAGIAVAAWVYDWAGNWTAAASWNLGMDRTPPSAAASVAPMYGDAPFRDFKVFWGGSDNLSGIARYTVQVRDGAEGAWTDLLVGIGSTLYRFAGEVGHTYAFRVQAQDHAGNSGAVAGGDGDAQYTVVTCPISPDRYEPDGQVLRAAWHPTDGLVRIHTNHAEGDHDWISFYATTGVTYTIMTTNSGGHADTVLSLFDRDGSTLLASNDDGPDAWPSSRLDWQPSIDGIYYARVHHWDEWAYGCTTAYGLVIRAGGETLPPGGISYLPLVLRRAP
ncbi:MAG: pre-peptidase C-terminal domain-containing protein [Anaerolineae bacterium]|nr:pre-peptidase C-terminal domain-containing protein [Anaerolineae bacterium]